jgi:protein-tyrosine kinase
MSSPRDRSRSGGEGIALTDPIEGSQQAAAVALTATSDAARRTTTAAPATTAPLADHANDDEAMLRLHYQIAALLPGDECRSVQFIGSRPGEGTSTIAREFALISATRFGQRVLLLELDLRRPGLPGTDQAPVRVDHTTLYAAPLPREFTTATHAIDVAGAHAAWQRLRTQWDLVVLDSPPAALSPESLAMVGRVDGVVLIVEAETTRWPVAARAKESIVRSGGRVLGVVLNKRRHYIPAFIYNWL